MPLLGALQYNEWFTGVDASNMKMVTIEYNFEIYVISGGAKKWQNL